MPEASLRTRLRALALDRRGWIAAALLALWMPVFHGESRWYRDALTLSHPLRAHVRARLLAGELPLWCDALGAGRPVLATPQSAVLDPLNALFLALPVPFGLDLAGLVYHLVLAFGARRWLRELGSEDDDATVGAMIAALSGYAVSTQFSQVASAASLAWVPWALAALLRASRVEGAPRWRAVALAALCLACAVFAGDPTAALFALLLGLAQCLGAPTAPARRRALADLAAAAPLAALVASVQLLPALEVARAALGEGVEPAETLRRSFPPRRLIELVAPGFFGEPYTDRWFVHGLYPEVAGRPVEPWAPGVHLGAVTLPLGLAAVLRRGRARVDVALGALALLSLLVALGRHTPLAALWRAAPSLAWVLRHPERYLAVATLAAAALAARGLPVARARLDRAASLSGAMSVAMLLLAAATFFRGAKLARRVVRRIPVFPMVVADVVLTAASHGAAWLLAYHAAALLAAHNRVPLPRARLAVGALFALELTINALPLATWGPSRVHREPSPLAAPIRRGAAATEPARVLRFVDHWVEPELADVVGAAATLQPNVGLPLGVAHIDPNDPLDTAEARALHFHTRKNPLRAMRLQGARFVVTTEPVLFHLELPLRTVGRLQGTRWLLAEDGAPGAAAYVPARVIPARGGARGVALAFALGFTPGVDAVVEGGLPRGAAGACALTRVSPERISLRCNASAPAYAVVSDRYFPGWRATVNGRDARIHRANGVFRAVEIPAGISRVEMRYAPWGLYAGAALTTVGLCAALALIVRGRARRKDLAARSTEIPAR